MDFDIKRIGARVMRPERPRLAEARAVVIGLSDVREAWEALIVRALVPAPWGSYDPGAFRSNGSQNMGASWQPATEGSRDKNSPSPPSIDDAVALASDPEGISRASQVATEHYARVRAWRPAGCPEQCPKRVWSVHGLAGLKASPIDLSLRGFYAELFARSPPGTFAAEIREEAEGCCGHLSLAVAQRFSRDVLAARIWEVMVETGALQAVTGTPYAELPDPTEPLMNLWSLGYALGPLKPDELSMIAPAV